MLLNGLTIRERIALGAGSVMVALLAATILAVLGVVMAKDAVTSSTESVCDTE